MKKYFNRNSRNFQIESSFEAGVVLSGPEVKSVKTRGIQLGQSSADIKDGEIYLYHAVISPYKYARNENYNPSRPRKLLIKKKDIAWLTSRRKAGLTIVPLACYTTKRGWVKIQLGIGRRKKKWELKRELVAKEIDKEIRNSKF